LVRRRGAEMKVISELSAGTTATRQECTGRTNYNRVRKLIGGGVIALSYFRGASCAQCNMKMDKPRPVLNCYAHNM
jgi:hypothetical protein